MYHLTKIVVIATPCNASHIAYLFFIAHDSTFQYDKMILSILLTQPNKGIARKGKFVINQDSFIIIKKNSVSQEIKCTG